MSGRVRRDIVAARRQGWRPMQRRDRLRLSGAALRTFLRIARAWRLSATQQRAALGGVAPAMWRCWLAQARRRRPLALSEVVLLRLSLMLGVFAALKVLLGSSGGAARWLRARNRRAAGRWSVPLAVLTGGSLAELARLRRTLAAMASAWEDSAGGAYGG